MPIRSTLTLSILYISYFITPNASRPRTVPFRTRPRRRPRTKRAFGKQKYAFASSTCVQITRVTRTMRLYSCYTAFVSIHAIHVACCEPIFVVYRRLSDTFYAGASPNVEIRRNRAARSAENGLPEPGALSGRLRHIENSRFLGIYRRKTILICNRVNLMVMW